MTPKVQYAVRCYQPGTSTVITSLRAGQPFDVAVLVDDLREEGSYIDPRTGQPLPLLRGVYAAYCNLVWDKKLADLAVFEQQAISFGPTPVSGTFRLSQGGKTSRLIGFNNRDPVTRAQTAAHIQAALNAMFGARIVTVTVPSLRLSRYDVTFSGRPNIDVPLLSDDKTFIKVTEVTKGDPSQLNNLVQALNYSDEYQNGREAIQASYGIASLGAFANSFTGTGAASVELVRMRMVAKPPANQVAAMLTFRPDFSAATNGGVGLEYPMYDTLVMGNLAAGEASAVDPSEIEAVPFTLTVTP